MILKLKIIVAYLVLQQEDMIARNFEEYVSNKDLIKLPIPILHCIVSTYYSNKHKNKEQNRIKDEKDFFIIFLF